MARGWTDRGHRRLRRELARATIARSRHAGRDPAAAEDTAIQVSRRPPARPVDRSSDRRIALIAITVAIGFLAAAVAATLLPETVRRGLWLPLHLALAGAATTAIAGVMPFFSAALAAAPPSDRWLRIAAVAGVALGAIGVSAGITVGSAVVATLGGGLFLAGVVLVAVATVRPTSQGLGPGRGVITWAYVGALVNVSVGATLATAYAAGWAPAVESWARLRPAHAWLNVVGFVSLVIAATLLHFFPTVVGARIGGRRVATAAVTGLAVGAPVVALGSIFGSDLVGRAGAAASGLGAAALGVYAWRVARTRARWTTDPSWHRFAIGGLVSALAWFLIGMAIAVAGVLIHGSSPLAWNAAAIAGPLAAGWAGIAVVASASHLLPAVGPGDAAAHARQRRVLGRLAWPRLIALNGGVAALSIGLPLGVQALVTGGVALVALGLAGSLALIGAAIAIASKRD